MADVIDFCFNLKIFCNKIKRARVVSLNREGLPLVCKEKSTGTKRPDGLARIEAAFTQDPN